MQGSSLYNVQETTCLFFLLYLDAALQGHQALVKSTSESSFRVLETTAYNSEYFTSLCRFRPRSVLDCAKCAPVIPVHLQKVFEDDCLEVLATVYIHIYISLFYDLNMHWKSSVFAHSFVKHSVLYCSKIFMLIVVVFLYRWCFLFYRILWSWHCSSFFLVLYRTA